MNMGVTYQVWEWSNVGQNSQNREVNGTPQSLTANQSYDIFNGTVGNQTTIPAAAKATQFVVIEDLAVTPTNDSSIQITVNTTDYFQNPDISTTPGIPATAIPYPCGASPYSNGQGGTGGDISMTSFKMNPALYILPGQKWTMTYSTRQGVSGGGGNEGGSIGVMIYYMLYDGADALIANKLMEMGVPVSANNVDWYKQEALAKNLRNLTMTGGVN